REGGAQLRQHPRLPRRLPALAGVDRQLPRAGDQHARDLDRRHHRALPADPGDMARALLLGLGAAARARLRRALPPPLGLLPELVGGRLPRASDRRRAGAVRQAGRAVSGAAVGAREPLLLIHGLGGSRSIWEPVAPMLEAEREVIAL